MEPVRVDFEKRVSEIETFIAHLGSLEIVKDPESSASKLSRARSNRLTELEKILKANLFLLLYNLVESTVRLSLMTICDSVASEGLRYTDLKDEIQRLWIKTKHKNFQNLGTTTIFEVLQALPEEIVELTPEQKLGGRGNLDARKIREFAEEFGFSSVTHYRARNGEALFLIKKRRNDLAHGLESFAECGRQYSIEDLVRMKQETVVYLRSLLRNVSRYLQEKQFRAPNAGGA